MATPIPGQPPRGKQRTERCFCLSGGTVLERDHRLDDLNLPLEFLLLDQGRKQS